MAGCENCFFGGKKVGYKGKVDSPFVIVGESPGPLELAKGKPFVGPSGKLLDEVLAPFMPRLIEAGCEPFVTNAINCIPRQKDVNRLSQAVNRCCGRLKEEVQAHPRKVILALGNGALWSLTGKHSYKITQVRGQVFESELAEAGIVASVHPSYLLRGSGNLGQFRRDIEIACRMALDEDITGETDDAPAGSASSGRRNKAVITAAGTFEPGKYAVLETAEQVAKLAARLKTVEYVAADFETDGFIPRLGRVVNPPHTLGQGILCIGICFKRGTSYVIPGHLITPDLFDNDAAWCWHNGKFDVGWGREYGFEKVRVDDDTMLLSYLMNERGGIHDLEQVGGDWLQAPNYKNMLEVHLPSKKHSYAYIPKEVLYEYQAIDVELTFWLRDVLRDKVKKDERLWRVYTDILIPASEFLHQVERDGFLVDEQKVEENTKRLGEEADKHEIEFSRLAKEVGINGINCRSPQQVKEFLYGKLKLGRMEWSTDKNQLELLPPHPAVQALKRYRQVHKQLSTFVTPIWNKVDENNRLHTTFKLHGTTTGRLSSSKPNLQNIPRDKDIRGQFIAAPGRAILEVDLAQAELRVLACLSGDKEMIRIFRSGVSLHDEVAEYLFGKGFNKEQKMIAKNINFGIIYGISAYGLYDQIEIGAQRLGSDIHVTAKQCQQWIDEWFERFPEAHAFLERCKMAPVRGVTLISAFGRRRRFNVVSREKLRDMQNEAMNFPEQSAAHDITLLSGIEVREYVRKEYDCIIVNEVHDCLVNDIPDDMGIIVPCAKHIMGVMERVPADWGLTEIPFLAEAEIGFRWGNGIQIPHDVFKLNPKELKGVSHVEFVKKAA